MTTLTTEDICQEGEVYPTPIPFSEAVKTYGVYRTYSRHLPFNPIRSGPGLIVTTDAVLYINDGYVCDATLMNYTPDQPFYLTSLPLPDRIIRHRP